MYQAWAVLQRLWVPPCQQVLASLNAGDCARQPAADGPRLGAPRACHVTFTSLTPVVVLEQAKPLWRRLTTVLCAVLP